MIRSFILLLLALLTACSSNPAQKTPSVSLFGTWWRATEIDGRNPDFLAGQKMDIFVTLFRQGRLKGSGGCNHIDASFSRTGQNIRFGQVVTTRMACSQVIMSRERAFTDALRKTASWVQDGRELRFCDRDGRTLLRFMAVRRP
jgi:copper homeostasis protein (lipoprotein)